MDYFSAVLTTFLGLEYVSCVAVCRARKLLDFIQNIWICVLKNKGLMGLELHKGEKLFVILAAFNWLECWLD